MATAEIGTLGFSIAEVEKCIAAFRHYAKHGPGHAWAAGVRTRRERAGCGTAMNGITT
jgi:hypothetical protein